MRISASMTLREQRLAAFDAAAAAGLFIVLIVGLKFSDAREQEFLRKVNANTAEGLSALSEPQLLQMREKLSHDEHAASVIDEAIGIKANSD